MWAKVRPYFWGIVLGGIGYALAQKLVPSWLVIPLILVGIAYWRATADKALAAEFERNNQFDPPSEQQLKWHLRHVRHDTQLACHLLMAIAILLAVIAFR